MYKALSKITKKIVCKVVISMVLQSNAHTYKDFPGGSAVKNSPANAGDTGDAGSIPGSGRCPGEGNGNPLQYSYLENPMDRGGWQAIVHVVTSVGHDLMS